MNADALRNALADSALGQSPDDLLRLVEKALLQEDQMRQRSIKGALGQKAAADSRCKKLVTIAAKLIAERNRPFDSYRQLAGAVAKQPGVMESERTIRQHLAAARVLES